ncbi:MAG TPA: FAD-dependent oxidoreductase, partial [Chloroflexota bacterium]|nr:FAD-dependent oxidoreductase [Chloroflexota bacterium]
MKQTILAKEHDSSLEVTIFHNGIRAFGKEFERFYHRAAALPGVRFVRSYVSIGPELPDSKRVVVKYSLEGNGVAKEEFDLVVLSTGLRPPVGARELADKLGITLNQHGFCATTGLEPMATSRPAIFASGAFVQPMDIPDSVVAGSSAAARCQELLVAERGTLAKERVHPPERVVVGEEPRVGVFVCRCGTNIGRVIDVPALVEYASTLPNVVHAEEQLFSCAPDSGRAITDRIAEKSLNRVIVAACTPRTHEGLFRDTLREGGINEYLFELANIREHCSWVHSKEKERATEKAKDIVRMAVARARLLESLEGLEVPVTKKALIIGGGLAGMTCALNVAGQGFESHLIEKERKLGGVAGRLHYLLDGSDIQSHLRETAKRVYENPLIHVHTNSTVVDASGFAGNFNTTIKKGERTQLINSGVVIVATGVEEHKPTEYLYGEDEHVLTLLELEERMGRGEPEVVNASSIAMILCVGCRNQERNYCSRVCCGQAIKCALQLKKINPAADIYIIHRDVVAYGFQEDFYREAANQGVRFVRYTPEDKPQVVSLNEGGSRRLSITVTDVVLGKKLVIESDVLALAAAAVPPAGNADISKLYKVA